MTPQRWKGAGILCLALAALLVIAAVISVFTSQSAPSPSVFYQLVEPGAVNLAGAVTGVLRGVVLGAFAGVAFFLGLSCFAWSGLVEAREQRAEILAELTALRRRAERDNPPAATTPPPVAPGPGGAQPGSGARTE